MPNEWSALAVDGRTIKESDWQISLASFLFLLVEGKAATNYCV